MLGGSLYGCGRDNMPSTVNHDQVAGNQWDYQHQDGVSAERTPGKKDAP